jgi:hypothetical protein
MYTTAPTTAPRNDTASPTPMRPTNTNIVAWARHARASNGFGEATIGLEPCPSAQTHHIPRRDPSRRKCCLAQMMTPPISITLAANCRGVDPGGRLI